MDSAQVFFHLSLFGYIARDKEFGFWQDPSGLKRHDFYAIYYLIPGKGKAVFSKSYPNIAALAQAIVLDLPGIFNRKVMDKAKTEMDSAIQKAS